MTVTTASEHTVWSGSPSQILNLAQGLRSLLVLAILVAVFLARAPILNAVNQRGVDLDSLPVPVGTILLAIIAIVAIMQVLKLAWAWFAVGSTVYTLTEERFIVQRGVINRRTDTLELYRVTDVTVVEPLLTRLVGAGDVVLLSDDRTTPAVRVKAIYQPLQVMALIRKHSEAIRQQRRLLLVDNQ
ncbi:MAG: PH domain-containing protein [Cyanobacteria bacterium P01_E01_bin.45]